MHVQTETKPYDSINVTPMLDLAYVLLVIFIIMTTASVQGLTINLPKPSNKPNLMKKELRVVQVRPGEAGRTAAGQGGRGQPRRARGDIERRAQPRSRLFPGGERRSRGRLCAR